MPTSNNKRIAKNTVYLYIRQIVVMLQGIPSICSQLQ